MKNIVINNVAGVSWPRSGHGVLARFLKQYFGTSFIYCPDTQSPGRKFHNCWRNGPCEKLGKVHFCKNHDPSKAMPKISGGRYLVQYRDFIPSVISSFETQVGKTVKDDAHAFKVFAIAKAEQYSAFLQKWVFPQDNKIHKIIVPYEFLMNDQKNTLINILRFFGQEKDSIDMARLQAIAQNLDGQKAEKGKLGIITPNLGMRTTRQIEDFRYYTPELAADLQSLVQPRRQKWLNFSLENAIQA